MKRRRKKKGIRVQNFRNQRPRNELDTAGVKLGHAIEVDQSANFFCDP